MLYTGTRIPLFKLDSTDSSLIYIEQMKDLSYFSIVASMYPQPASSLDPIDIELISSLELIVRCAAEKRGRLYRVNTVMIALYLIS